MESNIKNWVLYLSEINCTQREINSSRWVAYSSDREIIRGYFSFFMEAEYSRDSR
jgi:hypothetical protein